MQKYEHYSKTYLQMRTSNTVMLGKKTLVLVVAHCYLNIEYLYDERSYLRLFKMLMIGLQNYRLFSFESEAKMISWQNRQDMIKKNYGKTKWAKIWRMIL